MQNMKPSYTWKDGSPMSQTDANNIYRNRGKLTSDKNDKMMLQIVEFSI